MIEPLESRRYFDAAITGGPGHAGIAVDVWYTGSSPPIVTGVYTCDFFAAGYFGDVASSHWLDNVITGATGRVYWSFQPKSSIHDGKFGKSAPAKYSGDTDAKTRNGDFNLLLRLTGDAKYGPSPSYIYGLGLNQASDAGYTDATYYTTYSLWGFNCYSWTYSYVDYYLWSVGKPLQYRVNPISYDDLMYNVPVGNGATTIAEIMAPAYQNQQLPPGTVGGWHGGRYYWGDGWNVWDAATPPKYDNPDQIIAADLGLLSVGLYQ